MSKNMVIIVAVATTLAAAYFLWENMEIKKKLKANGVVLK